MVEIVASMVIVREFGVWFDVMGEFWEGIVVVAGMLQRWGPSTVKL